MKNILIVAMMVILSACTSTPKVVYTPAPKPVLTPPVVNPIKIRPVEWKVMTRQEVMAISAELEANPDQKVTYFVLTPKGFANLQSNMIETKRYIKEQKQVLVYYKTMTGD